MGLNNQVSSARAVSGNARIDDHRYAPPPVARSDRDAKPQVTLYEREGFAGRSFTTDREMGNFKRSGFNDRASSVVVAGERWEVCEDAQFGGRCAVLRPGNYPSLAAMGLNNRVSSVRDVSGNHDAKPQVTFYEREGYAGRTFTTETKVGNFKRSGFNDRASSVVVAGDRWEVCEDSRYRGRCAVLRPGNYPSLAAMGLNNRVSSVREVGRDARIEDSRYAPEPAQAGNRDYRRRQNERLYDANVTSVRAVVGTPGQRCWVEQQEVAQEPSKANVPGAIAGALIGGILGHQVGNGRGNDLATVGGVIAGAAVGANINRGAGQEATTQDVKRCESVPSHARPELWDVTYNFRGQEHRVQMTSPPGATISVNDQGEPRA
ncbi:MAG: glycine zipper 2TM domain-containing protein [Burkholderiales bacterium]|nr:glycine zipper 2TM domain-containing protein [Burkholderiales bacterium]